MKYRTLKDLADTHIKLENWEEAKLYGLEAEAIHRENNIIESTFDLYHILYTIYKELGKNEKAEHYLGLQKQAIAEKDESKTHLILASFEQEVASSMQADHLSKWIYSVLLISIGLIATMQVRRVTLKRIQAKKDRMKLAEEQELIKQKTFSDLKALKAQINPHFLFNSLNSIQSFVLEGSNEIAEDYLVKYGRLMRLILNHSNELTIPLHEEIELIQLYVSLEKVRLSKSIKFELIVDESVDQYEVRVPSMIIQPLLENAIWHGIQPLQSEGEVTVSFTRTEEENIQVTVKDNGVGFDLDNLIETQKPKGFRLVKERIELLNSIQKVDSNFDIISNESGTKVVFTYPTYLN